MSIKQIAVQKAIAMLQAANAQYSIVDEEGKEYTNIVNKRRKTEHPFGSVREHYKPYIQDMEPGDLVEVPNGNFPLESIQSGIVSWFCTTHGSGSCMTALNRSKNVIEVIRLS